jgi:hypothetical protein
MIKPCDPAGIALGAILIAGCTYFLWRSIRSGEIFTGNIFLFKTRLEAPVLFWSSVVFYVCFVLVFVAMIVTSSLGCIAERY